MHLKGRRIVCELLSGLAGTDDCICPKFHPTVRNRKQEQQPRRRDHHVLCSPGSCEREHRRWPGCSTCHSRRSWRATSVCCASPATICFELNCCNRLSRLQTAGRRPHSYMALSSVDEMDCNRWTEKHHLEDILWRRKCRVGPMSMSGERSSWPWTKSDTLQWLLPVFLTSHRSFLMA